MAARNFVFRSGAVGGSDRQLGTPKRSDGRRSAGLPLISMLETAEYLLMGGLKEKIMSGLGESIGCALALRP